MAEYIVSSGNLSELYSGGTWFTLKMEAVSICETFGNAVYIHVAVPSPRDTIHIEIHQTMILLHAGVLRLSIKADEQTGMASV
jgi:hypothetical protein